MQYLFATLTIVTFFPLVGVAVLLFVPNGQKNTIRWVALATTLVTFALSLVMLAQFNAAEPGLQLEVRAPWIQIGSTWNINYHLGVDGLSVLLVLLTTFLTPLAIASTWEAIEDRVKEFMIFFLLLEVGMTGVFVAQDLFLFYIFWEFTLVPMYFLIGIWGGPRKIYAAIKFFLYTMAGSILMLLAILYLGITQGTFSVPEIIASSTCSTETYSSLRRSASCLAASSNSESVREMYTCPGAAPGPLTRGRPSSSRSSALWSAPASTSARSKRRGISPSGWSSSASSRCSTSTSVCP